MPFLVFLLQPLNIFLLARTNLHGISHQELERWKQISKWVVCLRATWATFKPRLEEIKKAHPKKGFLIFPEIKLSSSNIKKVFIFWKERFSYIISSNETLHLSPQAEKIENSTQRKFLILQGTETPKKIIMFQEMEALKKLLIFQEVTCKIKNFLYFSL